MPNIKHTTLNKYVNLILGLYFIYKDTQTRVIV